MNTLNKIGTEYLEYVDTAATHESPVDGACIMQQCFDDIPDFISDEHAQKVLSSYHNDFNGKLLIDLKTIKQIISALAIIDFDKKSEDQ